MFKFQAKNNVQLATSESDKIKITKKFQIKCAPSTLEEWKGGIREADHLLNISSSERKRHYIQKYISANKSNLKRKASPTSLLIKSNLPALKKVKTHNSNTINAATSSSNKTSSNSLLWSLKSKKSTQQPQQQHQLNIGSTNMNSGNGSSNSSTPSGTPSKSYFRIIIFKVLKVFKLYRRSFTLLKHTWCFSHFTEFKTLLKNLFEIAWS
jgi:hypothetical protein